MIIKTDRLLQELTEERDAAVERPEEPVKLRATFELTVPAGVAAAEYKEALLDALQAFANRSIFARVFRLEFAPTRTLPPVTLETP
jgi:hypothetical protein